MAHRLYHTEAFVVASQPSGETSRAFWLFTDQLGLVVAEARAVREVKSKLRYHLTTGALVRVALVRGRERWRLVGVETVQMVPVSFRRPWASALELIRTLFATNHPEPVIFLELKKAFAWLAGRSPSATLADRFRIIVMYRLLYLLGQAGGQTTDPILSFDWENEKELGDLSPADLKSGLKEVRRALAMI